MKDFLADVSWSFTGSRATTSLLLLSAAALWAFVLVRPPAVLPDSNDVVLSAASVVGDLGAPLQIVYFYRSDCSWCHQMSPNVRRLIREHGDAAHARFVQVTTDWTAEDPIAAVCADRTGASAGAAFEACSTSTSVRKAVEADLATAKRLGIGSVPAILIGESSVIGAMSYPALDSLYAAAVSHR